MFLNESLLVMEVEQRKTRAIFLNENEIRENVTYIILFNNLFKTCKPAPVSDKCRFIWEIKNNLKAILF